MFKIKIATIAILLGGIILAALSYLVPEPKINYALNTLLKEGAFHSTLAYIAISTAYGFGGALLFLPGLNGFSAAFRRTYYLICAGLNIQAVGSLVYLYALYTGIAKSDMATLVAEVPLVTGIVVVYVGYILYARLLGISKWLTSAPVLILLFATLMMGTIISPHRTDIARAETIFDIAHALQSVELVTYCLAALLAYYIRRTAGPLYARSMLWSMWAMITAFPPTLVLFIIDFIYLPKWVSADGMTVLFIVTNILTIASAYAFNRIARAPAVAPIHDNTLLDGVTYLASLASNPSEIDPILDKVRVITASHQTGTVLNVEEERQLHLVYTELEEYLLTKERLRAFDRQGLNDLMQKRFNIVATK